jgi:lipopolysaccharide biosynthesis glycosyltransferase
LNEQPELELRATTKAEVEAIAARAREALAAGDKKQAAHLFGFLVERDKGGSGPWRRLAELRLDEGNADAALSLMENLRAREPGNFDALRITGRALLAKGMHEEAVEVLKDLVVIKPDNVNHVRLLFTAVEQCANPRSMLDRPEQYLGGLPESERLAFLFRAAIIREDFEGCVRIFELMAAGGAELSPDLLRRSCASLFAKEQHAVIAKIYALAGGAASAPLAVVSAQLRSLLRTNDLQAADALLLVAEPRPGFAQDLGVKASKLTLLCRSMRHLEARELLDSWEGLLEAPKPVREVAMRLYAATKDWNRLLDLFREHVQAGLVVSGDIVRTMIAAATRETGRYAEMLSLLESVSGAALTDHLAELKDALRGEIIELQTLGIIAADVTPSIAPPDDAVRRKRIDIVAQAVGTAPRSGTPPANSRAVVVAPSTVEIAIYSCTDLNYLLGASVALFSLLRANEAASRDAAISAIVSRPALDLAQAAFARIANYFGAQVEVVAIDSIFESDVSLRDTYGFYSPSRRLSGAAYWRIFAAKWLQNQKRGRRALYLDSDVCVGPGLNDLLDFDLAGRPLAARVDNEQAMVRTAAANLGVDPDGYFNSGVLLFDLHHPALSGALDQTIEMAIHRQEKLTFHDQCALNHSFHNLTTPLPARFNAFVRPRDGGEPPAVSGSVIRHYLDAPKPWDPQYPNAASLRWLEEFSQMAEAIGPQLSKRLLSIQFERTME